MTFILRQYLAPNYWIDGRFSLSFESSTAEYLGLTQHKNYNYTVFIQTSFLFFKKRPKITINALELPSFDTVLQLESLFFIL